MGSAFTPGKAPRINSHFCTNRHNLTPLLNSGATLVSKSWGRINGTFMPCTHSITSSVVGPLPPPPELHNPLPPPWPPPRACSMARVTSWCRALACCTASRVCSGPTPLDRGIRPSLMSRWPGKGMMSFEASRCMDRSCIKEVVDAAPNAET